LKKNVCALKAYEDIFISSKVKTIESYWIVKISDVTSDSYRLPKDGLGKDITLMLAIVVKN
jgi:hypothetical protein